MVWYLKGSLHLLVLSFGGNNPVQSDADTLVAMVKELNVAAKLEVLDEAAVRLLSYTAQGDLAPVNAFIGGLAAQEVIKVRS